MFQHVAEPGAFAFAHAADEAAGLAIRAAVFGQPRQGGDQTVDKGRPQFAGRPLLQLAQIQLQPDHREVRIQRRADEDGTFQNTHELFLEPEARCYKM